MTSERRFEQDLPALLAEVGVGPRPDYRDDIVRRTASVRQRPAWTLPERWLPMSVLTTRAAAPLRYPWRVLAVAALIGLLILGGALIVAGSRPPVPAPFGRAANGLIAYAANGDIYTIDPASGATTAVAQASIGNDGPVQYDQPTFSRDGTRLAFVRSQSGDARNRWLVVSAPDGSGQSVVAATAQTGSGSVASIGTVYGFSPDGQSLLFTSGDNELMIANVDGSGVRSLHVVGDQPSWLPPNGAEIVYAGIVPDGTPNGIYAIDAAGGIPRTILAPVDGVSRDAVTVSPDGSQIAYSASSLTDQSNHNTYEVHVVLADGTGDVTLPRPPGSTFEDRPVWSNDGTRLAVIRGYDTRNQDVLVAVVPADGSSTGVETRHKLTGCCDSLLDWAPADSSVVLLPEDSDGNMLAQLLIDPATGAVSPAPGDGTSPPAWQRRAP